MTSTPTSAGPRRRAPRPPVPPAPGAAPGAFLFATSETTLRTAGVRARVPEVPGASVAAAADATLAVETAAGRTDALVVGALGFSPGQARLVVPTAVDRCPTPPLTPADVPPAPPLTAPPSAPSSIGTRWYYRAEPGPPGYASAVRRAVGMIHAGRLDKVVLARAATLTAPEDIDIPAVLGRLAVRNPSSFVFAADVAAPDAAPDASPRTLLGASPELLVARHGTTVTSHPLAGTTPRSPDPDEDARRAAALEASGKDRHEHALVVGQVAECLAPFCSHLEVPDEPSLTSTPGLWHLGTRIRGTLRDPAPSALVLAEALHPTPAVCGEPAEEARDVIAELEEVPRNWYAGLVGWCDAAGDGEWALAIRSADVTGRSVRLYAGAGIVAGSRPEAEVAETSAKFRTLLTALGLESTP